jgi:hypothetical protein
MGHTSWQTICVELIEFKVTGLVLLMLHTEDMLQKRNFVLTEGNLLPT